MNRTEAAASRGRRGNIPDILADTAHYFLSQTGKRTKDGALLTSVAESIGSTLGTIAAKANAAPKALTRSSAARTMEREGRKLDRKSEGVARKTKNAAARNLKRSRLATRRGLS